MKLVGYLNAGGLEYCFALPVFGEEQRYWFQVLQDGRIKEFELIPALDPEISFLPLELGRPVSQGDEPIYVYLKQHSIVIIGSKQEVEAELLEQLLRMFTPVFSKLEITIFLQNQELFNAYSNLAQSDLHRRYPRFKGTITVDGAIASEPNHLIRIAGAPSSSGFFTMIRMRLPEAETILKDLIRQNRQQVLAMVLSYGGSAEAAEDILQEALAAFLELVDAGKIRSEAKVSTILYAIAKNKVITAFRKNKKSPLSRLEMEGEHRDQPISIDTPETEIIHEERVLLIKELVEALEPDASNCTQLLLARYHDTAKSNEALAVEFGYKNASVISAKLHNCKRALMKRIAMNPVLLGQAMDFLNSAQEIQPLIDRFADRLPEIFAFLQGNLPEESKIRLQNELESDSSLRHLVRAMQANFSH
jgi:RNA polymerase sigma factor (sigma-70 family)